MIRSFSRMLTAEKSSNDSAQSPACSRNAFPDAHLTERLGQPARLSGEHERGEAVDLLEGPVERALVGPVGLLTGREGPPRRRRPAFSRGCVHRQRVAGRGPAQSRFDRAMRDGARSPPCERRDRAAQCAAGARGSRLSSEASRSRSKRSGERRRREDGDENGRDTARRPSARGACARGRAMTPARWGDQAARMRAASSRRPVTARLTRRRAASAVTPSSSPTSR